MITKVKVCGITNFDDASAAADLGADMLGFNFYKGSPRYIEPTTALEIIDRLPASIEKIGVFVNERATTVCEVTRALGLNAVQLHGDESPEYLDQLNGSRIIKAFRISFDETEIAIGRYNADSILIDAFSRNEFGGTGKVCDWEIASRIARRFPKTILSGGLSPGNVKTAIIKVRPFAVDACSLLESEKGKKDHSKMKAFIEAAKEAI
jgi:phosphoribosylanthranilate isomerase